jgi:very-short-patch-repair endonuclease
MATDLLREWLARPHPDLDGGSPIENMMHRALMYEQSAYILADPIKFPIICTQDEIGPYRADFRLFGRGSSVVVECDGHAFHERTKEQAARDKKRDRYMTEAGHKVLRFTGSEVYANPFECARQALRLAAGYEATEDA